MQPSLNIPQPNNQRWVYAELIVCDGPRQLKPSEVSFDLLRFAEPPHLTNTQVEIILTNGDQEQRRLAMILPHDADATQIPIRLLPEEHR
jgi:hypothetical protein